MAYNRGWSRALDLQMDQHKWQLTDIGMDFTTSFFMSVLTKNEHMSTEDTHKIVDEAWENPHAHGELFWNAAALAKNLVITMWRGDTIFLTKDMQHLIMQAGHDLPPEAKWDFHTLITPCGFCLFEETIYGQDRAGKTIAINAIAWNLIPISDKDPDPQGRKEGLSLYFFCPLDDMQDDINRELIPDLRARGAKLGPFALGHWYATFQGDGIPNTHEPGAELVTGLLQLFMAMNLVAQQRIGEPVILDPDRATRRRIKREFGDGPERRITLITLRRKSVKRDDEDEQKIERTHRWIVRGHWRRQPDKNGWHWTYIYEYVKGPEDKPLLITERRIFNFRR